MSGLTRRATEWIRSVRAHRVAVLRLRRDTHATVGMLIVIDLDEALAGAAGRCRSERRRRPWLRVDHIAVRQPAIESAAMLNENDVVAIVERFLCEAGWTILQRSNTAQTGPDLEAKHPTSARRLFVEAKGATSARPGSARYTKPFNRSQVRDHVANAFYVAAKVPDEHLSAIAVPRTPEHEDFLEAIRRALVTLKIAVLWIGEDKVVTTWNWQDNPS